MIACKCLPLGRGFFCEVFKVAFAVFFEILAYSPVEPRFVDLSGATWSHYLQIC